MNLCECGCGREVKEGNKFINGHNRSFLNKHHSEEAKKKISNAQNGNYRTEEAKNNMKGWHHSRETKEKLSLIRVGKCLSKEIKKKISDSNTGKHHSRETKKKMSEVRTGKYIGELSPRYGKSPPINSSYGKYSICNKGHLVRSSYERKVANWLFSHNINYEYEKQRFYFFEISYLPDFYITNLDLWIETKGYMDGYSKLQIEWFLLEGYELLVINDVNNLDETLGFLL